MEIFYTDGQVFESRKESYIAVVDEDEKVIFFGSVGYRSVLDTEGLALLQCLRHIDFYEKRDAQIYTDSLTWAGILAGHHPLKKKTEETVKIVNAIQELKYKWNITITWKRRTFNKAGFFLGRIWQVKEKDRKRYFMRFQALPQGVDTENIMPTFDERRKFFDMYHQELASKYRIPVSVVMFIRSAVIGHRKTKEEIIEDCTRFLAKKEEALSQLTKAAERQRDRFDRYTFINGQKEAILDQVHTRQGIMQIIQVCPEDVWGHLNERTEFDKKV